MKKMGISAVAATVLTLSITILAIVMIWIVVLSMAGNDLGVLNEKVEMSIVANEGYTLWDNDSRLAGVHVRRGIDDAEIIGFALFFVMDGKTVSHYISEDLLMNMERIYYINLSDYSGELELIMLAPVFSDGKVGFVVSELEPKRIMIGELDDVEPSSGFVDPVAGPSSGGGGGSGEGSSSITGDPIPVTCQLFNASWNVSSVVEGDVVDLIIEGSDCVGENINFKIYENDLVGDDLIVTINGSYDRISWTSIYIGDGVLGGDPEFYFIATLIGDSGESFKSGSLDVRAYPLACSNDSGCSSVGNYCDGNVPYSCSLGGDGCLDRVDGGACGSSESCVAGGCVGIGLSDYVAYYMFDVDARDESGNHNGVMLGNAVVVSDGEKGNVLSLDGDGDYVDISNPNGLSMKNSYSISSWVKSSSQLYRKTIFSNRYGGCSSGDWAYLNYKIRLQNTGLVDMVFMRTDNNFDLTRTVSTTSLFDDEWHHVVGVYDGTDNRIYVDGVLEGTRADVGVPNVRASSKVTIGIDYFDAFCNSLDVWWDGLIDDVMVYDRVLSASEIGDIYDAQNIEVSSCSNDSGCSSVGNYCDGNVPYSCSLGGDGCLDRVNGGACGSGESCVVGGCVGNIPDDYIAYYSYDVDARDETGNYNGVMFGGAGIVGDLNRGNVLGLDGVDDYVSTTFVRSASQVEDMTFSAWIYSKGANSANSLQGIVAILSGDNNGQNILTLTESAGEVFSFSVLDVESAVSGNAGVGLNEWNHVVGVFDFDGIAGSSKASIYVNGELIGSGVGAGSYSHNADELRVGLYKNYFSRYFNGFIDDVIIYDRVLDSSEILDIYNSQNFVVSCVSETVSATCGTWSCGSRTNNCGKSVSCGTCASGLSCSSGVCIGGTASTTNAISQFGITWTFSNPVKYGTFANGDYWVVGPVSITSISPPSINSGGRIKNGAMINPSPRVNSQGYDNKMDFNTYDSSLNVAYQVSSSNSLIINEGSSVSTISEDSSGVRPQVKTAAILTVLDSVPAGGSFRPGYTRVSKDIKFNKNDLDYSKLGKLSPVSSTPAWSTVERYFERPWVDHRGSFAARYQHPSENMPDYGQDMSNRIGIGALMLNLDYTDLEKETLMIRYVQLGIDFYSIIEDGGTWNWYNDGGHGQGRKWPILFAGLVLDDYDMKNIGAKSGDYLYSDGHGPGNWPSDYIHFGEDDQTHYVANFDISINPHNADSRDSQVIEYSSADLGLPEWGIRHSTEPNRNNKFWETMYRRCCTANNFMGYVLAAQVMDARDLWNHDVLFDYEDRYIEITGSGGINQGWWSTWSGFASNMWNTYRDDYGCTWTMNNHNDPYSKGYYDCAGAVVRCSSIGSCGNYPNARAIDYDPCSVC